MAANNSPELESLFHNTRSFSCRKVNLFFQFFFPIHLFPVRRLTRACHRECSNPAYPANSLLSRQRMEHFLLSVFVRNGPDAVRSTSDRTPAPAPAAPRHPRGNEIHLQKEGGGYCRLCLAPRIGESPPRYTEPRTVHGHCHPPRRAPMHAQPHALACMLTPYTHANTPYTPYTIRTYTHINTFTCPHP